MAGNVQGGNDMSAYLLECCVDSVESALIAAQNGADRLELCSNLVIGGTTPSLSLYNRIREQINIPIHILIRPRFGDFLYSEEELQVILGDIRLFAENKADGIVIGCLAPDGSLDVEAMKRLTDAAHGMSVTLHRAFDMCRDPYEALEQARELGIRSVLTSGQADSCQHGIPLLNSLHEKAGQNLHILAGAGINADTVSILLRETSLTHFHMSGKRIVQSGMRYRNCRVSMGLKGMSEYEIWQTDPEAVRAVRRLLGNRPGQTHERP